LTGEGKLKIFTLGPLAPAGERDGVRGNSQEGQTFEEEFDNG